VRRLLGAPSEIKSVPILTPGRSYQVWFYKMLNRAPSRPYVLELDEHDRVLNGRPYPW